MRPVFRNEVGTTLLELVVAAGIMAAVSAMVLQLLLAGRTAFVVHPEIADMQQRLRVAVDQITRDLRAAGSGIVLGERPVPLTRLMPAIRPARRGLWQSDGELAAFDDRLSILYAPFDAKQAPVLRRMASAGDDVWINGPIVGCAPGTACRIRPGAHVLLLDLSGVGAGYDLFAIAGRQGDALRHADRLSRTYAPPDGWMTEVIQRVYHFDAATNRLMRYDGHRSDQPVVDDVAGLEIAYFADPSPWSVPPPPSGEASCVYDAGDPPRPRLRDLGGQVLHRLTLDQLRDGPVCGVAPNRFDGDLLRVRRVRLTLTLQASAERLRRAASQDVPGGLGLTAGAIALDDASMTVDVALRVPAGWLGPELR